MKNSHNIVMRIIKVPLCSASMAFFDGKFGTYINCYCGTYLRLVLCERFSAERQVSSDRSEGTLVNRLLEMSSIDRFGKGFFVRFVWNFIKYHQKINISCLTVLASRECDFQDFLNNQHFETVLYQTKKINNRHLLTIFTSVKMLGVVHIYARLLKPLIAQCMLTTVHIAKI